MVHPVDSAISLDDALLGVNVPQARARAVVDAMERDVTPHVASKSDLESVRLGLKADIGSARLALKGDIDTSKLVIRLGALMVVLSGLVTGFVKLA